jgi:DNA-binding MarR family transcriptional regulator
VTSYFFHLFAVIGRHREARLERELKPLGINLSRHRALSVIHSLERCTMSELAEYTAVDRTTLTRTVDQLVDAGLVERTTPREDRRQVLLNLTDVGRATCQASLSAIFRVNRELLASLPQADQRGVARSLETVLGSMIGDPDLLARVSLRGSTKD